MYVALIDAAIAGEAVGNAPAPWDAWLVVALIVQRERQRWHREIVNTRCADTGLDHGDVPGMPGWTFVEHGIGVCLEGPDGEVIDVDFRDAAAAVIDPWFFATRVKSVAASRVAEGRLWRWRPKSDLVVDGLDALVARGVIALQPEGHCFTLAEPLAERAAEVAADLARPDAEVRWRRALGDVDDAAQREAYDDWLVDLVATSRRRGQFLDLAVTAAGPERGMEILRAQLAAETIDYATGRAIEVLRRPELPPCADVAALLRRLDAATAPPYPGFQAVAYLVERGLEPELARARFDELAAVKVSPGFAGNPFTAEFAILALHHLPERALPVVRAALRSSTPICVQEMASLLAAIDRPWCQRELLAALPEAHARNRATLVAAVRHSANDLARRRAGAHDVPPPRDPEAIGFTYEEVAYANADAFTASAVEKARPVAEVLRARFPDDWDG
jgi:hypothetical protein